MSTIDKNVSEVFSRPNREAKIHDLEQFALWTETPGRPGYRSNLRFGERNGAPRISVFPNIEGTPSLWIGFDPVSFMRFLDRFEEIANGPNGESDKIGNNGDARQQDQRKGMPKEEDLAIRNTLHFGKSNTGLCWMAIEQKGVENIRFILNPSMWHVFYKKDGTPFTNEESSAIHTRTLIQTLRRVFSRWTGRLKPPFERPIDSPAGGKAGSDGPKSISTFDDVQF